MKIIKTDIVIVAAGTAGIAAAVTAAECGKKVIVFEKSGTTGGSANLAVGLFAVESRLQKLRQIDLTKEEAFKIHMDFTHWRVDARLVKTFYEKSAATIDWLESMGVQFFDVCSHNPGFNYTQHIIGGMPKNSKLFHLGAGRIMMKIMTNRAKELGVDLRLKTPVKKLIKKDDRIIGVISEDSSGEEIQVNADAVILATGGFGGNTAGFPGLEGDGIRMAREVGAEATDGVGIYKAGQHKNLTLLHTFRQPNLMINLFGERFMNEEISKTTPFAGNPIELQKDKTAFMILDEDIMDLYIKKGYDYIPHGLLYPMTKATDFDSELNAARNQGDKSLFVAKSLEDLAAQAGIDPAGLKKTVDEYNRACETGRDELFYKSAKYLKPIRRPSFYVRKLIGHSINTWEGIKINYKTEVLTPEHIVIPGLYATGNDAACNIYTDGYPSILPGNTFAFAINTGRMAAENAIEYLNSSKKALPGLKGENK